MILARIKWIFAKGLKILLHPAALNRCTVHKTADISAMCDLTDCCIGKYTYIGYNTFAVNTTIGTYCSIANGCVIGGAAHSIKNVSTSPIFNEGKNTLGITFAMFPEEETKRVVIDNDVWLGHGVYIKSGVHISTGAVVGMGAVVTKDIGPYEIWAGNPARFIRKRFDDEIIDGLLKSKWWEMTDTQLKNMSEYFDSPKKFIQRLEQGECSDENCTLG